MKDKTEKAEKKAKSLYFEARVEVALPPSEAQFYGCLKVIAEHGFKAAAGPLGIQARYPGSSLEAVQESLTRLGQELRANQFKVTAYSLGEIFTDSGSFDALQLLEVPPHADKP